MTQTGGTTGTPVVYANSLDALIPFLRMKIGDTNPAAYRYTDTWLRTALIASIEYLGKWWNFKYLLDANSNVFRNPNYSGFIFDEATYGTLEPSDKQIVITMAAYILIEGSLENAAWDFVSWADAEIRYSNLESSRARNETLKRLWTELTSMLKVPAKRLMRAGKQSLPGYIGNEYERTGE